MFHKRGNIPQNVPSDCGKWSAWVLCTTGAGQESYLPKKKKKKDNFRGFREGDLPLEGRTGES